MPERALVLGGGGVTGIAWLVGMLAGLADEGVHLDTADLVVGTSAGSAVGSLVAAGLDLEELYADQLADGSAEVGAQLGRLLVLRMLWIALRSRTPQQAGARAGRLALAAGTVPEAERRKIIEARLGITEWPRRRLLITAVDAVSGAFRVFDRDSGVPLVDAVAASCAVPGVWPPVTIDGRRWIDGGMRSSANADLAAGHDRIVVLAPIPQGFGPFASVPQQAAELGRRSRVTVVVPDRAARQAIGRDVLDPARRAPAARAGRAQASLVAPAVAGVWSEP